MVAIDLITEHIRMKLQQPELRRIYVNLEVIPSNYQIRGMHTLIRDASTSKADFVFYADRLLRLVRLVTYSATTSSVLFSAVCVYWRLKPFSAHKKRASDMMALRGLVRPRARSRCVGKQVCRQHLLAHGSCPPAACSQAHTGRPAALRRHALALLSVQSCPVHQQQWAALLYRAGHLPCAMLNIITPTWASS